MITKNLGEPSTLRYMQLNGWLNIVGGFSVFVFLVVLKTAYYLFLNIPRRSVVEVIFSIRLSKSFLALRTLVADFIRELPHLFLNIGSLDPKLTILQLITLGLERSDIRIWWQRA